MKVQFDESNKEYELLMLETLWWAWQNRPRGYTDASGVSLGWAIERFLTSTGAKKPNEIECDVFESSERLHLIFRDDSVHQTQHRITLEIERVKELVLLLNGAIEKIEQTRQP